MDALDVIYKIAMIVIAIANIGFSVYIFITNHKRDLTKTLVLDHISPYFYVFFENLDKELSVLKDKKGSTIEQKQIIQQNIQREECVFEQQFIDIFLCIDKDLHRELKAKIDALMDGISEAIFDEGINLYVENQYNDKIKNQMIITKSDILNLILKRSR